MIFDQTARELVAGSLRKLREYILNCDFAGYDPYDALNSPLFRLPGLRSQKLPRLAAQQILRRLPMNLRPFLRIPPGKNPVTYGLCIQAFSNLALAFPNEKSVHEHYANKCLQALEHLQSRGYGGACWGYDFDWEARYASIPAYTPTIVATGMITNALFQHYAATKTIRSYDLCREAVGFITHDLHKSYENGTFSYSYSPLDHQRVFNATMKGARLLAQVFSLTGEESLRDEARATVRYVVNHQNMDGSWGYAYGDTRTWVDNFHTGYILDCLDEFIALCGDDEFRPHLQRGVKYYLENLLAEGKIPKFYNNSIYPIDSTAAAQSIITLCRFGKVELATAVAAWMINHMQHPDGFFYYQRSSWFINRISYMRWSNAWMFAALSKLLMQLTDR